MFANTELQNRIVACFCVIWKEESICNGSALGTCAQHLTFTSITTIATTKTLFSFVWNEWWFICFCCSFRVLMALWQATSRYDFKAVPQKLRKKNCKKKKKTRISIHHKENNNNKKYRKQMTYCYCSTILAIATAIFLLNNHVSLCLCVCVDNSFLSFFLCHQRRDEESESFCLRCNDNCAYILCALFINRRRKKIMSKQSKNCKQRTRGDRMRDSFAKLTTEYVLIIRTAWIKSHF